MTVLIPDDMASSSLVPSAGSGRPWSRGPSGPCGARAAASRVVLAFTVSDGRVAEIRLLADPERLAELDLVPLDD